MVEDDDVVLVEDRYRRHVYSDWLRTRPPLISDWSGMLGAAAQTTVEVRWIPGHKGIASNERADRLAKAALRDLAGMDTETPRSHACQAQLARQRRQDLVAKWWADNAPDAYRALGLEMRRRKPPELRLARRTLHKLLAARTGHGDFAAYHRRFNHPDANLLCHCGQEKSPIHFLRCRASPTARANSHRALSGLIESHLGPRAFENFPKALEQD